MNAAELNHLLVNDIERVVKYLLPSVKIKGSEAMAGSVGGEDGESLKIHLRGSKAGYWADFASGQHKGKSLIGLWSACRNVEYKEAIKQIKDWLGIKEVNKFYKNPRAIKPIKTTQGVKLKTQTVRDYLIHARKLNEQTLKDYRIGEHKDGRAIAFPYFNQGGDEIHMVKYLALERDERGKKKIWAESGSGKVLFGKQTIKNSGELVIHEGEIDSMSSHQMGYPSVSVPYGAKCDNGVTDPNLEWIENDFDFLDSFERIYLCMDADEEGQKAAKSIAKRLGIERCFLVQIPDGCKDANDVLVQDRAADFHEAIENAKQIEPDELRPVSSYKKEVWEALNPSEKQLGVPFLLEELKWNIRKGELTIWTGINGHGKSECLYNTCVHLAHNGVRSCIASFEIPPAKTIRSLVTQSLGVGKVEAPSFESSLSWLDQYFWIIDHYGPVQWAKLLELMQYARRRHNVTNFVIDSLMFCGVNEDDLDGQKRFVTSLASFCKDNDCHIHLVAHARKGQNESEAPGKMDIKGSGAITDAAHNVITVFRNVKKDEALSKASDEKDVHAYQKAQHHMESGRVIISKQRETGVIGWAKFFYDVDCRQFKRAHQEPPKKYVA